LKIFVGPKYVDIAIMYNITTHSNLFYTLKGSFGLKKKARTILNGYARLDEVNLDFEAMFNTVWQTYGYTVRIIFSVSFNVVNVKFINILGTPALNAIMTSVLPA
jgi:hypothetical protein